MTQNRIVSWPDKYLVSPPKYHMCLRFVVLFLGLISATGCSRTGSTGAADGEDISELPDQETWGAVLRSSENGEPTMTLAAPYMARFDRPDSSYAIFGMDPLVVDSSRVRVQLFDNGGEISASMLVDELVYIQDQERFRGSGDVYAVLHRADDAEVRADSLEYLEEDQLVVISGNVFVTTSDGRQLSTRGLTWSADKRQITTAGFFEMTSARERIQGYRLVASEDLRRYTFSQASGEFEVDE